MVTLRFSATAAAAAMITTALPAWAASKPPPVTPAAVQRVLDCRALGDDAARLKCFDAAVAAMSQAESSGDLVSIDRAQRRAARRQAFGLPLPSLAFLDRGERPEEANRILATVASATVDPYGKWTIRLEDGAVWRQIDDTAVDRAPHPGSKVEIDRAMLGSFRMKIDGQFPIRVHRDQ